MSAALRQSYLRAMGLPLYVPRFVLPGAAVSPKLSGVVEDAVAAPPETPTAAPVAVATPRDASAAAELSRAAREVLTEPVVATNPLPVPASPTAETRAEVLRFHAAVVDTGIGLRMVADVSDGPLSDEARKLMANIARAVAVHWQCADKLAFSASNFEWPLVKAVTSIRQGAIDARDALSARVVSEGAGPPIHLVLLFGDSLQAFLNSDYLAAHQARLLCAADAEQMLGNADHKAALWAELRAIRAGG